MKISKTITKIIAGCATGVMLFAAVASASTIKVPNMSGITVPYSTMVNRANAFDSNLGALIVDSFVRACYSVADIDKAITNTNNAINALNNLKFWTEDNAVATNQVYTGAAGYGLVRDNGQVNAAKSYLSAAQLSGAVQFSLSTARVNGVAQGKTDEYYNQLAFKVSTPLYSTGNALYIVNVYGNDLHVNIKKGNTTTISDVVDKLNAYKDLLNAVKAFDQAAGCYDTNTTNTTNTTNKTNKTNKTDKTSKPVATKDAVITVQYSRIKQGSRFVIMDGVRAIDNGGKGADITNKVTIKGTINTAKVGTYTITYSVKGANGKTVSKTVNYQVVKDIYQGGRHYDRW